MKKLIIVNGTMGVGKSAVCSLLNKELENSVWLDGDWCWMMNPFIPNEENRAMVEDNINHLLRNFINNSSFEYVIFNWVIHSEDIFEMILNKLSNLEFEVSKITLMCSEESLKRRILKDIADNLRDESCIERSIERLPLYENMDTIKIDTSNISVKETVNKILEIVK